MSTWTSMPALSGLLEMSRSRADGGRGTSPHFGDLLAREIAQGGPPRVVKVTGTNGKGSVCAMLDAALRRDGKRVGLFTSPHLSSPTERFRVDGRDVDEATLDLFAGEIGQRVAHEIAARGEEVRPSFFELLVLVAARMFRAARVDVAIIEAGVGGYNDATSLLTGEVSAITGVALDHQDRLGSTVEAIAADKAGIASEGSELIVGPGIAAGALRAIEADAARRGVTVYLASEDRVRAGKGEGNIATEGACARRVHVRLGAREIEAALPLLGHHQIANLATAALIVERLHARGMVRDPACLAGVEETRWPARMELRPGDPAVLLDVAHNEQGIAALCEALDRLAPRERRRVIYGASADKDYAACLPYLPRLGAAVHVVEGFYRAEKASTLARLLPAGCAVTEHAEVTGALRALLGDERSRRAPGDGGALVIVTGSVFLVGAARDVLSKMAAEGR